MSTVKRVFIATPESLHDAELVRRFNAGDENAFMEIVARYQVRMLSVALNHLRNRADAEEIAQDTFIRAYRGLVRFRGESSLSSWLHRIVFNLSCNRRDYHFRRYRHATRSFDSTLNEDDGATFGDLFASDLPGPVRDETNREFLAEVAAGLKQLNAAQRKILTLRISLNRSYEEIATTLGISEGTVKSRLARARESLRGFLAQAYDHVEPHALPSLFCFEPNRPAAGYC